jgi:2'-5' RNA ligase
LADRNEHLVVVMLETMPTGKEYEIWPRHITIVPWFPCDDEQRLDKTLQAVALRHKKLIVRAGKIEQWGKRDKFMVQKIDDEGALQSLHLDVFHSLEKNGFRIHQKDYLAEKYDPHFTLRNRLQRGNPLERDSKIAIPVFALIKQMRLKGSGRMIKSVVKEYELR